MRFALLAAIALLLPIPAVGQVALPLDAPIPNDLKDRVFLPPAAVAGVRDKMERVVGYWAFVTSAGKIEVTAAKPTSFIGTSGPITKVSLGSGKPSYEGVITKSSSLTASVPVLSVAWSNNQRGQVTITDSAQFVAGGDPSSTDWDSLPKPTNGGHWVFIDSATVSVLQVTVLTEKSGSLGALLSALNIGGKNYQAMNGTTTALIVSLFVKQNPADLAGMPLQASTPSAISVNASSLNAISQNQP